MSELYRETLALLCSAYADFVEADRQIHKSLNKDGSKALLIKSPSGAVMENPLLYTRKRAWDQVFKAAACFGMTPADISGVKAAEKPTVEAGKKKFFGGAG